MQKLTEIKEAYTVKRMQMVDGVSTPVEEIQYRYKNIPFVEGLPRFGHFLFDRVFFFLFTALVGVVIGVLLVITGTPLSLSESELRIYETLLNWLILQPLFYFIFEATMQASPAKAILGRIVVDEYGNKPTTKQIFIRSISRCVPFEVFSCLGTTGWHDDWSNTYVIRKKDLAELRLLQKINNIETETIPSEGIVQNDSN